MSRSWDIVTIIRWRAEIIRSRLDQATINRHRRSGDRDLREEISEAIKSKHKLVLNDPWHDLKIERYLSRVRVKCFNNIMIETGKATNLVLGSVKVVVEAREFVWWSCVGCIGRNNTGLSVITRRTLGDWLLIPERATYSCSCSQNFMRQSITARLRVIPWDLCIVPAKISRKSNGPPMNSIPFGVFSMGVFVNAVISPFLNWEAIVRFSFVLHNRADPWRTRTGCQYFWAKWTELLARYVGRVEAGQMSQSSWWHRFTELQAAGGD
jgi:hypothetical protein